MNDNLDDFIRQTSDTYLFEMFLAVFKRILPENNVITQILILSKKYGMPVKNILSFIQELGEWCSNNQKESTMSASDTKAVHDLLRNSGFMTIGFTQEGDDSDGNG